MHESLSQYSRSAGSNQGSRFTVRLPLTSEAHSDRLVSLTTTTPLRSVALDQTDFLIVDDSEDTIAMFDQFLKISGAKVTSANNGADALRLAREKEFDVILSDISMPEMDGFEFLQRLPQIEGRQNVPVVAITGFGRNADVERARKAGFFSHLTKPLDLEALAAVLEKLTNGHNANNGKS